MQPRQCQVNHNLTCVERRASLFGVSRSGLEHIQNSKARVDCTCTRNVEKALISWLLNLIPALGLKIETQFYISVLELGKSPKAASRHGLLERR